MYMYMCIHIYLYIIHIAPVVLHMNTSQRHFTARQADFSKAPNGQAQPSALPASKLLLCCL